VPGNDDYVQIVESFASISRGAFMPTAVSEAWAADETSVVVELETALTRASFRPELLKDWIDPRIAEFAASFFDKYELCRAEPLFERHGLFFAALDANERTMIESERGLSFVPVSPGSLPRVGY
jgi:hypothetical protein